MIRYELLRMLRNRKWKYLIPAALLAYIYISGVSSFTVTEGSIYQDQQIQAAACLVSFLFLSMPYCPSFDFLHRGFAKGAIL